MSPFDSTNREAFAKARASLVVPAKPAVGLGHLLLAAAFAAGAGLASAAAIILGVPGIDRGAAPAVTTAWGLVHLPASRTPAAPLLARR